MATCKECLHSDVCEGYYPTDMDKDVFHYCRDGRADEIPDIEKRCGSFKDRSRFVDVVRCDECVSQDGCSFEEYQGMDGYCSLGERREA